MAAPANVDEFLDLVRKSGVVDEKRLDAYLAKSRATFPPEMTKVAGLLIQNGIITNFQSENILLGKWKRFSIGKYKILERLGSGGFAQVYLCEHKLMRRKVAVKVLPIAKNKGSSARDRFYREARALDKLDHPNIVHFYDIDQDSDLHFIVLEYVDGSNLQEIVRKSGPMPVNRACHYIAQAAHALQHAHEHGMVHRDIKPGNILVDRTGVVKLLDLGLAMVLDEKENQLTRIHDDGTLGTADYLSPEQAMDSHDVDIRADIYSLGVTFYYMLTGRPPYEGLHVADKLLAHQMKQPPPITDTRSDVPAGVLAIINKMMAKKAEQRYTTPEEVADALAPFTQTPIAPPPAAEMPVLSPAASGPISSAEPAAPAPPRPAAPAPTIMAPSPQVTAEQAPWEQQSGTDEAAPTDFTPSATHHRKPSKSGSSSLFVIILVLGFIVIPVFLVIVIGATVWFFIPNKPDKGPEKEVRRLQVSKDPNRKNAFRSIQAALKNAETDCIVELWDDAYEENVVFDGSKGGRTRFTLQAAPGREEITWKAARNDPDAPILRIIKAPDFKLKGKGIYLDGALADGKSVNDLMMITSDCSGLTIDDLQMRNFARTAILVMNATGSAEKPIRLDGIWTFTQVNEKPRAAVYFDANPNVNPPKNDHIEIRKCQFRGLEPEKAIQFNDKLGVLGDNVSWPGR